MEIVEGVEPWVTLPKVTAGGVVVNVVLDPKAKERAAGVALEAFRLTARVVAAEPAKGT